MDRKNLNVIAAAAVFLALLLMPVVFAGCLPTEVNYDCTAVRTDTLDAFAQGDTLMGDLHCQQQ